MTSDWRYVLPVFFFIKKKGLQKTLSRKQHLSNNRVVWAKNGEWTCLINCYPGFSQILKVGKNSKQKCCFQRRFYFFLEIWRQNRCDRTLYGVYLYKISGTFLEECSSLDILNVENGNFSRYFVIFLYFPDFHFSPIWISQIYSRAIFLIPDEMPGLKICITPPKPEIFRKASSWPHDLT